MTKTELIEAVAQQTGQTKKAVSEVIEQIVVAIQSNNQTVIRGFGTFKNKTRAAKTGRNPQTGATIQIAAKQVLVFKASK